MIPEIIRTQVEIDKVLEFCDEISENGNSPFWGMTYEEGLRAMYDWLTDKDYQGNPVVN